MVLEQLVDEYKGKGYEVKIKYPLAHQIRADIYAVNDSDRIVIEFVDEHTPQEYVNRLKKVISDEGMKLNLVDFSKIILEL